MVFDVVQGAVNAVALEESLMRFRHCIVGEAHKFGFE